MDAAEAGKLIKKLKLGPRGWSMTLPASAGQCFGQRIDVLCTGFRSRTVEPPLDKQEIELLTTILTHLPQLAARAEQAWEEYGGEGQLDESDRLSRPRIFINRTKLTGPWAMVIEIAGSSFGWHVEFEGLQFKEIWAAG